MRRLLLLAALGSAFLVLIGCSKTAPPAAAPPPAMARVLVAPKELGNGDWRLRWSAEFPDRAGLDCGIALIDLESDGQPEIVTTAPSKCVFLAPDGNKLRSFELKGVGGGFPLIGKRENRPYVALFGRWGSDLVAYDTDGKILWEAPTSGPTQVSIDSVATYRFSPTEIGLVIGYHDRQIELIRSSGKLEGLFRYAATPWGLASARLRNGYPESFIIADGNAQAFAMNRSPTKRFVVPEGARAIVTHDPDGDGLDEVITLGTAHGRKHLVSCFSHDGKLNWSADASGISPATHRPVSVIKIKGKTVIGVSMLGGAAFFGAGKRFGDIDQELMEIAALPGSGDTDGLLIRSRGWLACYDYVGE